jgi:hypothetical protein
MDDSECKTWLCVSCENEFIEKYQDRCLSCGAIKCWVMKTTSDKDSHEVFWYIMGILIQDRYIVSETMTNLKKIKEMGYKIYDSRIKALKGLKKEMERVYHRLGERLDTIKREIEE